jgi:surface carbohydrate biosynthesis protein
MDIVIFYEFEERELTNACLLKCELEKREYEVEIAKVYEPHIPFLEKPKLIITPFLYNNLDVKTYASYFFQHIEKILNLQYEQVISKKWLKSGFHCPKDMAKNANHICWSESIKKRLKNTGINDKNLFVAGDLKTDFGRPLFKDFFLSKKDLAQEFSIDPKKEWILFISSFTLPNAPNYVIDDLSKKISGDGYEFKKLMVESKKNIIDWIQLFLIEHDNKEFIYRPHPNEAQFEDPKLIKLAKKYPNFHVISDYSVQEWIINSDFINTWISTSIIDAYFMNKHCNILRPVQINKENDIPFLINSQHISSYSEFKRANNEKNTAFPIPPELIKKYYKFPNAPVYESICDYIDMIIKDSYFEQNFNINNESIKPSITLFQRCINEISNEKLEKMNKFQKKCIKIQARIKKIIGGKSSCNSNTNQGYIEIQILKQITNLKTDHAQIEKKLNHIIESKNEQIKKNTKQAKIQKNKITEMESSNSWKVTKPIRKCGNIIKKLKN